jgi:WD40 repeat protein
VLEDVLTTARYFGHPFAFSADSGTIALDGGGSTVVLGRVSADCRIGERHRVVGGEGTVLAAAFSPDGTSLATVSSDRTVRIWRLSASGGLDRDAALLGHAAPAVVARFSPDGRVLVTGDAEGSVLAWDTDVRAAARRVCAALRAPLTESEWHEFVGAGRPTNPC